MPNKLQKKDMDLISSIENSDDPSKLEIPTSSAYVDYALSNNKYKAAAYLIDKIAKEELDIDICKEYYYAKNTYTNLIDFNPSAELKVMQKFLEANNLTNDASTKLVSIIPALKYAFVNNADKCTEIQECIDTFISYSSKRHNQKTPNIETPITAMIKGIFYVIKDGNMITFGVEEITEFVSKEGKGTIDEKNTEGQTPLICAIENNKLDVAKILIDNGANINTADNEGESPLISAIWNEHLEMAKTLVDKGANINAADNRGNTPLTILEQRDKSTTDYTELLEALKKADENIENLITAIRPNPKVSQAAQLLQVTQLLEDSPGLINNTSTDNNTTPLITAAFYKNQDMVALLLEKGADITAQNSDGHNAITAALWIDNNEIASTLVEKMFEGQPNTEKLQTKYIQSAKDIIKGYKDDETFKKNIHELQNSILAPDTQPVSTAKTPSFVAPITPAPPPPADKISNGKPRKKAASFAKPIAETQETEITGNNLNNDDSGMRVEEKTPAVADKELNDKYEAAKKTILSEVDLSTTQQNLQNLAEIIVLKEATYCTPEEIETIKSLKDKLQQKNPGILIHTPINAEIERNIFLDSEGITNFANMGYDFNAPNSRGDTPLIYAINTDNETLVSNLLNNENAKVNPNITDINRDTPLILAVRKGWLDIAKKLIKKGGADAGVKDSNGQTLTEILKGGTYTTESKEYASYIMQASKEAELAKKPQAPTTLSSVSRHIALTLNSNPTEDLITHERNIDNKDPATYGDTPSNTDTYTPPANEIDIRYLKSIPTNNLAANTTSKKTSRFKSLLSSKNISAQHASKFSEESDTSVEHILSEEDLPRYVRDNDSPPMTRTSDASEVTPSFKRMSNRIRFSDVSDDDSNDDHLLSMSSHEIRFPAVSDDDSDEDELLTSLMKSVPTEGHAPTPKEPIPPTTSSSGAARPNSLSAAPQTVQQSAQSKPNTFQSASLENKDLQEAFDKLKDACAKIDNLSTTPAKYAGKYEFKQQTKNYELKDSGADTETYRSIDHLMADAVTTFNLNPITISGGNMQQQIMAMQSAMARGFTDITVIPEKGYKDNPEYNQEFDKTVELKKFTGHKEVLEAIKTDNTPDAVMDCLHNRTDISSTKAGASDTMTMK